MVPNTVSLTVEDEKMLTLFIHSRQYLDRAKIHQYLEFNDEGWVSFSTNKEERTCPIRVYSDTIKFYISVQLIDSKKHVFKEIQAETAEFLLKWMTFLGKVQECRKIIEALSRIYTTKNKKFEKNTSMEYDLISLMEERITMKQKQNEFVKKQMNVEAANMRDSIKEQEEKTIQYLLRTYPKRKIFKSIYLKEMLFETRTDCYLPGLY